jgi:hypothetical protein
MFFSWHFSSSILCLLLWSHVILWSEISMTLVPSCVTIVLNLDWEVLMVLDTCKDIMSKIKTSNPKICLWIEKIVLYWPRETQCKWMRLLYGCCHCMHLMSHSSVSKHLINKLEKMGMWQWILVLLSGSLFASRSVFKLLNLLETVGLNMGFRGIIGGCGPTSWEAPK